MAQAPPSPARELTEQELENLRKYVRPASWLTKLLGFDKFQPYNAYLKSRNLLPSNWPEDIGVLEGGGLSVLSKSLTPVGQSELMLRLAQSDPGFAATLEKEFGGSLDFKQWEQAIFSGDLIRNPSEASKKSGSFLSKLAGAPGTILGWGGEALGKVGTLLSLPAQGLEMAVGLPLSYAWYNNVPSFDARMQLTRLTWDNVFSWDRAGRLYDINADVIAGKSMTEILEAHKGSTGDFIGQFMMNPLWLIGGVAGGLVKPETLKSLPLGLRILVGGLVGGEGAPISLYKAERLGKIPGIRFLAGIIGRPPEEEELARAAARVLGAYEKSKSLSGPVGPLAKLLRLTPAGRFQWLNHSGLSEVLSLFVRERNMPVERLRTWVQAIHDGDWEKLKSFGMRYGNAPEDAKALHELFQRQNITADSFASLAPAKVNKKGEVTSPSGVEKVLKRQNFQVANSALSPIEWAFKSDWDKTVLPAIRRDVGYAVNAVDNILGWQKRLLNVFLLNRPAFVVLNAANNVFTLLFDYGLRALTHGDGPFGLNFTPFRYSRRDLEMLKILDIPPDFYKELVADPSTLRSFLGSMGKREGVLDWLVQPFVAAAGWLDAGTRLRASLVGMRRVADSSWPGLRPPLPEGLTDDIRRVLLSRVDQLPLSGEEAIEALVKDIREGRIVPSTRILAENFFKGRGMTEDAVAQAVGELRKYVDAMDEGLAAGQSWDDILSKLDDAITSDIHAARAEDGLAHAGTLGRTSGGFEADLDAHIAKHGRSVVDSFATFAERFGLGKRLRTTLTRALQQFYSDMDKLRATTRGLIEKHRDELVGAGKKAFDYTFEHTAWADYDNAYRKAFETTFAAVREVLSKRMRVAPLKLWNETAASLSRTWEQLAKNRASLVRELQDATLTSEQRSMLHELSTRRGEVLLGEEVRRRYGYLGMEPPVPKGRPNVDVPSPAEMEQSGGTIAKEYLRYASEFEPSVPGFLAPEAREAVAQWVQNDVRASLKDMTKLALESGRALANFTMHDYATQYNLDRAISFIAPYWFWPSRTVWKWGRRIAAAPGRVSAIMDLSEWQENAFPDLPDRVKGKLRIPLPFMPDVLGAPFFDPLKVVFPMVSWDEDFSFASRRSTPAGRVLDWATNVGVASINPAIPIIGVKIGLLDADAWLSGQMMPGGPGIFPGTNALMALRTFFYTGQNEEEAFAGLSEVERLQLIGRGDTPEGWLRDRLGIPQDKWDGYRIARAMVWLVGQYPDKYNWEDMLRGWKDKKGPLYMGARKAASQEFAMRGLLGYAISAPGFYPEGEAYMRGLDKLYREAAAVGDLDTFFGIHPEYQVRRVAQAMYPWDQAEADKEVDNTLYRLDFERQLGDDTSLQTQIDQLTDIIEVLRTNVEVMSTSEGRRRLDILEAQRAALFDERTERLKNLDATYPKREVRPSFWLPPKERVLRLLMEEWADIERSEFETFEEWEIARNEFEAALPADSGVGQDFWNRQQIRVAARRQRMQAEVAAGADYDTARKRMEAGLEEITTISRPYITIQDFNLYRSRNSEPPSPVYQAYQTAKGQMADYMAAREAYQPTISKKEQVALDQFWADHPLLESFYGNEPELPYPDPQTQADTETLSEIWDGFFERSGKVAMGYLYSRLTDLNDIRTRRGRPPIRLSWATDYQTFLEDYVVGSLAPTTIPGR